MREFVCALNGITIKVVARLVRSVAGVDVYAGSVTALHITFRIATDQDAVVTRRKWIAMSTGRYVWAVEVREHYSGQCPGVFRWRRGYEAETAYDALLLAQAEGFETRGVVIDHGDKPFWGYDDE